MGTFASASSDLVLRCYAPPFLAEAYRTAVANVGDRRELLRRRYGFIEIALRYSLAVLASEARAAGVAYPGELRELLDNLAAPSLGHWSKASYALAKAMHNKGHAPVADGFMAMWIDRTSRRGPRRTEAGDAFERLIEVRNKIAHEGAGFTCSEAEATEHLEARAEDFKHIGAALRFLQFLPLLQAEVLPSRRGTTHIRIQRLVGAEFQSVDLSFASASPFDSGEVLLLGTDGRVLSLSPFVVVGQLPGDATPTARLLAKWDRKARALLYLGAHDREPLTVGSDRDPVADPQITFGPLPENDGRTLERLQVDEILGPRAASALPAFEGYQVEALVGAGGSGTVYRARRVADGVPVALKVLHPVLVADPMQRRRLADEYAIMQRLGAQRTPGTAAVYEYRAETEHGPMFAMEWLAGNDLDTDARLEPFTPERGAAVLEPVLLALQAAHESEVFHRDVKPANILLDSEGHGRLIDFGIARSAGVHLTRTLESIGTMAFAAPEQLFEGRASAAADIYATGKTLAYLLMGRVGDPSTDERIPPTLRAIVRRATERDPDRRFQSAREMLRALRKARESRFGGPPVLEREAIHESYEVATIVGELAAGVWCLGGLERATDEPVGLLLAATAEGDALLRGRMQPLDPKVRMDVGWRATLLAHGRVLGVFDGRHVPARARMILGLAPEQQPLRNAVRNAVAATPFLVGLSALGLPLAGAAVAVGSAVAVGAAVAAAGAWRSRRPTPPAFVAQLERGVTTESTSGELWVARRHAIALLGALAAERARLTLADWLKGARSRRELEETIPLWLERARLAGVGLDEEVWSEALQAMATFKREGRSEDAAAPQPTEAGGDDLANMVRLLDALADVARAHGGEPPDPWIRTMPNGSFAQLLPYGSSVRYETLAANPEPELHPVPSDVIDQLARGRALAGAAVSARRRAIDGDAEKRALAAVRAWPFVGRIAVEPHATLGSSHLLADAVLYDAGDEPLAVLEVKSSLLGARNRARAEQQLWTYAKAFRTPFAILCDEAGFTFYRVDPSQGLVRVDHAALEEAATQTSGPA